MLCSYTSGLSLLRGIYFKIIECVKNELHVHGLILYNRLHPLTFLNKFYF